MIVSKITSKAQTTIPLPVRRALGLCEGDTLGYEIENGQVRLTRVAAKAADDPFGLFDEWASDADGKAYDGF